MAHCSHNRHFLTKHQRTSSEGYENLTHNDVADILTWLPEMDHQAYAEHFEREGEQGDPFEVPGFADAVTDDDSPETSADAIDVGHIASVCYGEVVDYF